MKVKELANLFFLKLSIIQTLQYQILLNWLAPYQQSKQNKTNTVK